MVANKQQGHRKRAAPTGTMARRRSMAITTYRIYADQRDALQREAMEQRDAAGGSGRADASAILRAILDRAGMKGGEYADAGENRVRRRFS